MAHPSHRSRARARRIVALVALVTAVAAGLGVHYLFPDTAITDIAGDALYAFVVYALIILVVPGWHPLVVGIVGLVGCVGIELFQLTGIPRAASSAFAPAMLALGTVFDPRDLVVYAITIVIATTADAAISRVRHERP